MANYMKC